MLEIRVDDLLTPRLRLLIQRYPHAIEQALDVVTAHAEQAAQRQVRRIYQRPIPRSSTGRRLWRRTGALQNSQRTAKAPWTRVISWQVAYANRRFNLGVTWMPRNPAGGVIRRNPAPQDTARIIAPQIGRMFVQELENRLD